MWSRAATKFAKSRLRSLHALPVYEAWTTRYAACQACPLHVREGGLNHCGRPMQHRPLAAPDRDAGCGCPVMDKARDPDEHCHLHEDDSDCTCPWCRAGVG
ncbi:MAG: hypothetical protein AAGI46_00855 [Planctomycetota bacterium]